MNYKILVRTQHAHTASGVQVTVLEYDNRTHAQTAWDALVGKELKDELYSKSFREVYTKLF